MKALCVTVRDPLNPLLHRDVRLLTKRTSIRSLAPKIQQPYVALLNGKAILRAGWRRRLRNGDTLAFIALPQGGGDSNPLAAILMVVVAVFAPYAAGALMGYSGGYAAVAGAALGTVGGAMLSAGIQIVGAMLVNALIPPPKPPSAMTASDMAAASPTYNMSAQGNSARLGQPIPVVYGRHMIYPDFGAQPYTEYAGNEQYLYQLFVIGQGHYDIETLRIEDTPVENFEEVEYEVIPPGGEVTLFPTNVVNAVEVSGQEAEYGVTVGPFIANSEGTQANQLAFDIVLPRGLYYANDDGGLDARTVTWSMEIQQVDDDGNTMGSWSTLAVESITRATTTPIRQTYRYPVYPGRYQCRVTRTNQKITDNRAGNDLVWAGLRAYLPGSQQYGEATLVATRMRATNNLSQQASRKINLIVQRKLPVWHPDTGWSEPQPTRNPAWAIADVARSAYGARLPDARINLAALYDLSLVWASRNDTCDMVCDSASTVWETLQIVCRTGRAHPFVQGGILNIFRDGPVSVPVAMFTPRNILKASFEATYKESPDQLMF